MRRPLGSHGLVVCAATALVVACAREEPVVSCTDIGCVNGVNLTLTGPWPDGPVRVRVNAAGRSVSAGVREVVCEDVAACASGLRFTGLTADRLVVTVTTPRGRLERVVVPRYTHDRPNGPRCEPECRNADIQLSLPP